MAGRHNLVIRDFYQRLLQRGKAKKFAWIACRHKWLIILNAMLNRITQMPGQCGGHPYIRGMRIRVADILEMLAENVSVTEILDDFPDLELADIQACLLFAAG